MIRAARPFHALAAALVAVALLVGGCRPGDPESELARALESTLDDSFVYTIILDGPAGEGPAELAGFLEGTAVEGIRGADVWTVSVAVFGFDVFEARSMPDDVLHVQLGLARVLALLGGPGVDPAAGIVADLERRGVALDVLEVVRDGVRGEWLTVEGPISPADLDAVLGGEEPPAADGPSLAEVLGGDVSGFVDRFVTVREVEERDDRRVFQVDVETGAMSRALAGFRQDVPEGDPPERVPGTVTVRDGRVEEITVDVSGDAQSGMQVRIEVRDHGRVAAPEAPEGATVTSAETFLEALRVLSDLFSEAGAPLPGR